MEGKNRMAKARITLAVDDEARRLIAKYGGKRGIGKLFTDLVKQHDFEETFGTKMVRRRLDRIEDRIIELLDQKEECMEP